ncbi:transcriptional regulator, partial [Salmonella enterica subsp. enterica serovar Newport]
THIYSVNQELVSLISHFFEECGEKDE